MLAIFLKEAGFVLFIVGKCATSLDMLKLMLCQPAAFQMLYCVSYFFALLGQYFFACLLMLKYNVIL